jgi:energy-coupling factor transporter ATP-binding protein EcfA2
MLDAAAIRYQYPQNGRGIGPISLQLNAGEQLLLSGPSGCGKSTLARCLTGFIPHLYRGRFSGVVRINGRATTDMPLWEISNLGGLLFQNPPSQLLTSSVREEILFGLENLGLHRQEMAARLENALATFDLLDYADRNPRTLSGGEQQRLTLAAMLARQPQFIVLDEPFSMIDSTAAAALRRTLHSLHKQGMGMLIAEHRLEHFANIPHLRRIQLAGGVKGKFGRDNGWQPPSVPPLELRVGALHVRRGRREIIGNINLALAGGQVIAVVGRNGSGKTTLLRALAGLQEFQGEIQVNGRPPRFGLVFQNPDLQLFNPTVQQEMLYGIPDPDMQLSHWLLEMLGLADYAQTPPLLLSEGEKKRLALATILMRQPADGLLLDEPSLGQDTEHKSILLRLLRRIAAGGRLVLLTTHDLMLAAQADQLILLGESGILAMGQPAELFAQTAVWQQARLQLPSWMREEQKHAP